MNGRDLRFKRGKSNNRRFNTVRANKRESVGNRLRDANTLTVASHGHRMNIAWILAQMADEHARAVLASYLSHN